MTSLSFLIDTDWMIDHRPLGGVGTISVMIRFAVYALGKEGSDSCLLFVLALTSRATGLEYAASVTGQRSNQLNYVPSRGINNLV